MSKWCRYFLTTGVWLAFFFTCKAQDLDSLASIITQDTVYKNSETPIYQFKEPIENTNFQTRNVSESDLNKLKSEKDYWYINQTPPRERATSPPSENQKGKKEMEERSQSRGLFNIPWLNVLFWIILIGGFVALLVWFLATSDIRLFRKKTSDVQEPVEEESTENIFDINFEKEIHKAVSSNNFRLAVRLMYLRTLKDLSDRNIINYTNEKTNSDYLFQLTGSPYYKNFFRLTRNFEYTWYGQFELSPNSFALIQNDFLSFKQQLS